MGPEFAFFIFCKVNFHNDLIKYPELGQKDKTAPSALPILLLKS